MTNILYDLDCYAWTAEQAALLRATLDATIATAYRGARIQAEGETGLPDKTFPVTCPYAFADVARKDFWPE